MGDFNFSVDKNAKPGTVVGQVNLSDPQGDELIYSLVDGKPESFTLVDGEYYPDSFDRYSEIDLDLSLIGTSNQDLDGDGIHPFSIDSSTGKITLTDFDDLDREAANNVAEENYSQLYHDGYYQLFVRVANEIPTEDDFRYGSLNPYETSIVNVQVVDIPTTPGDDDILGSPNNDVIKSLAGQDTVRGGAGNDSINGGGDSDKLFGDGGEDFLVGEKGADSLYGGKDSDVLIGSVGEDFLVGSQGEDNLYGGKDSDRLFGGTNDDQLSGGLGNDTLNGGLGDDTLHGGIGIDTLRGNAGADIFALAMDSGQDLITDFEDGIDLMGMPSNMSFEQLNILDVPVYSATVIQDSVSDEIVAVLQEIEANAIAEADFTDL